MHVSIHVYTENTKRNLSRWNLLVTWKTITNVAIIKIFNSPVIMILNSACNLVTS